MVGACSLRPIRSSATTAQRGPTGRGRHTLRPRLRRRARRRVRPAPRLRTGARRRRRPRGRIRSARRGRPRWVGPRRAPARPAGARRDRRRRGPRSSRRRRSRGAARCRSPVAPGGSRRRSSRRDSPRCLRARRAPRRIRGSPRGGRAGRWVRQSPRQGLSSGIHLGSVRFVRPVRLPEELVRVEHRERRAETDGGGGPGVAGTPARSRRTAPIASRASPPRNPETAAATPAERGGRDEQVRAPDDGESGEQRAPGNVRRGGARGDDPANASAGGTEGDRVALGPNREGGSPREERGGSGRSEGDPTSPAVAASESPTASANVSAMTPRRSSK